MARLTVYRIFIAPLAGVLVTLVGCVASAGRGA